MPSLGASGAIYAALTLTACAFPDTSVGLIFIPFFSLPIGLGVAGMVTFDIIGLIRGWRYVSLAIRRMDVADVHRAFDHVAHLGGAIFGVLYYQYGRQAWYWVRRKLQGLESESEAVSHPPRL
jgi:rhomboid-like protein